MVTLPLALTLTLTLSQILTLTHPNPYSNPNPNLPTLAQQLGTHRPQLGAKAAGLAMTAEPALKEIITKLCCMKTNSLGTAC